MPKPSKAGKTVRRAASATRPATRADLARLDAAMAGPVDTSDIPERAGPGRRVPRDAQGRLPGPDGGPIRVAILEALQRSGMSRHELWKAARTRCATLSESAVYEYLRGDRDIGVRYAEALIEASGLTIARADASRT
jgi:hypothetical protein